ncbi:hypothetical protein BRADI_1g09216v3 [Brachypodium distachyon]|uniref:Uncharacterized protein n=1 Tax=Brachypodium distachyon TaxID=15368 RepID=A0A0Q3J5U9_BRADI|nr:hypothetical protein BRADI_1g09216v3 [Brachypodium distachyon]
MPAQVRLCLADGPSSPLAVAGGSRRAKLFRRTAAAGLPRGWLVAAADRGAWACGGARTGLWGGAWACGGGWQHRSSPVLAGRAAFVSSGTGARRAGVRRLAAWRRHPRVRRPRLEARGRPRERRGRAARVCGRQRCGAWRRAGVGSSRRRLAGHGRRRRCPAAGLLAPAFWSPVPCCGGGGPVRCLVVGGALGRGCEEMVGLPRRKPDSGHGWGQRWGRPWVSLTFLKASLFWPSYSLLASQTSRETPQIQ